MEMKMNGKQQYLKGLQQGGIKRKKYYTDLKNMLNMSCQRNENRITKWVANTCALNYSTKFEVKIPRAQN